jgi:hypothetical protein
LLPPDARARIDANPVFFGGAVFDDRYAEARRFGDAMRRLGVPGHGLANGDTTALWHGAQDLRRTRPPGAIAGTTQFGPMFVFEQLGQQQRMRASFRVEHQVRSDGTIAHRMTGPSQTLALAEEMRQQDLDTDWPPLMAALLIYSRTDGSETVSRTMISRAQKPELSRAASAHGEPEPAPDSPVHYYEPLALQEGHGVPWDGPLFSWVIAPETQATPARSP